MSNGALNSKRVNPSRGVGHGAPGTVGNGMIPDDGTTRRAGMTEPDGDPAGHRDLATRPEGREITSPAARA